MTTTKFYLGTFHGMQYRFDLTIIRMANTSYGDVFASNGQGWKRVFSTKQMAASEAKLVEKSARDWVMAKEV
jgi:hypothetical protein